MSAKFLPNIVFILLLNLIVKATYLFGIDLKIQNIIGTEAYGLYFTLFNFSYIFYIITDLGLTIQTSRLIGGEKYNNFSLFKRIAGIKGILAILFSFIVMAFSTTLQLDANATEILYFIILNQILTSSILYNRATIAGLQRFKTDGLLSILDKLIVILICGHTFLISKSDFDLLQFVQVISIGLFSTFIISGTLAYLFTKKTKATKVASLPVPQLIKAGLPFALVVLLMVIYTKVDAVMLKYLVNDHYQQAGIYASSYRILDALNIAGLLFSGILIPLFAKQISQQQSVKDLTKVGLYSLITIAITATTFFYFTANEILAFLYIDYASEWRLIGQLLLFNFIPISITYIYSSLLTSNNNTSALIKITGTGVVLNIFLNWLLIPNNGALGATIATLVTQSIMAILFVNSCNQIFKIKHYFTFWRKPIVLFIMNGVIGFVLTSYTSLHWFYAGIIMTTLSLTTALVLRMVSKKDCVELAKAKLDTV